MGHRSLRPRRAGVLAAALLSALAARAAPPSDPFLKAAGNDLRNAHGTGEVVVLRGVNLGGWLNLEPWMAPMDASGLHDEWSALDVLERRFGRATRDRLLDVYRDTYLTTNDLDRIAALGLNLVRLPVWYRTLQEEDGAWREDGFRRMDWLVGAAAARGIYTIIDLHGAPGGQSDKDGTGRVRRKDINGLAPELWTNEAHLARTVALWERIAAHFRGDARVAAYDVLNEPMGAPDRDAIWRLYDRLYRAIRAADPDHVITFESCWSGKIDGRDLGWCWEILPRPEHFGWTNVLYQHHNYEWDWKDPQRQIRSTDHIVDEWRRHRDWGVPVFIGEFNCMNAPGGWLHTFRTYTTNGMSWSLWNYKSTAGTGDNSWGLYNPRKPVPPKPDLQKDSADEIAAQWARWGTAESFAVNPMIERALRGSRVARPELFVFDNGVGRGAWSPERQAATLKELGFAGISYNFTTCADLAAWQKAFRASGLKIYGLYVHTFPDRTNAYPAELGQAIRMLRGTDTVLWITLREGRDRAANLDEPAVRIVRDLAAQAASNGVRVAIYPHAGFYVGCATDAVRIARQAACANVGVSINLCHEFIAGRGDRLDETLREAAPLATLVSINGVDVAGKRHLLRLDQGDFDVGAYLDRLADAGYVGPIGLQCYSVPGDPVENLRRDLAAWRGMCRSATPSPAAASRPAARAAP